MHYVILRDDDTCALTSPAQLERLYRPFLTRGLPVNLAVIPEVRTDVRTPEGRPEGFVMAARLPAFAMRKSPRRSATGEGGAARLRPRRGDDAANFTSARSATENLEESGRLAPMAESRELVDYLLSEPGYRIVQHGCHHDPFEFGSSDRAELARRLERGGDCLEKAGFARPGTFVAPHDRLSRAAWLEVTARFGAVSTGWFEARKIPRRWWPRYLARKLQRRPHWRAGGAVLLSHPGCLLSYRRTYAGMAATVGQAVLGSTLTVLVTHWWEYFRNGVPDEPFIGVLHEVAAWLASRPDVRVVSFDDVAAGRVPLS